jgi:hypothetical protein
MRFLNKTNVLMTLIFQIKSTFPIFIVIGWPILAAVLLRSRDMKFSIRCIHNRAKRLIPSEIWGRKGSSIASYSLATSATIMCSVGLLESTGGIVESMMSTQSASLHTYSDRGPREHYLNLEELGVISYGGIQDRGSFELSEGGRTIDLGNNAWKQVLLDTTITPDTILAFDFMSNSEGEIHGIGFDFRTDPEVNFQGVTIDIDDGITSSRTFRLSGTQNWGIPTYSNAYSENTGFVHYEIPVGAHYTGDATRLFFLADQDLGLGANSIFRNIQIIQ